MSTETTEWFHYKLTFAGYSLDEVSAALRKCLRATGFSPRDEQQTETSFRLEAMYGSRVLSTSLHLLPIIGRHLPSGKRYHLDARAVTDDVQITVSLSATPYMEIFDSEEIIGFTQSIEERATDEYFTTLKLYRIIQRLHAELGVPLPAKFEQLAVKPFAKDAFWRLLLYPLDSFKSPKPVFRPAERGPFWCWGAFIIPEIWFLWHEIWGAAALAFLIEVVLARYTFAYFGFPSIVAGMLSVRLAAAYWGHRIYYFRYGKWVAS